MDETKRPSDARDTAQTPSDADRAAPTAPSGDPAALAGQLSELLSGIPELAGVMESLKKGDPPDLAGLLSKLGTQQTGEHTENASDAPSGSASDTPPGVGGLAALLGGADGGRPDPGTAKVMTLLGALRPFLKHERVGQIDRAERMLRTAQTVRGALRAFSALSGDREAR